MKKSLIYSLICFLTIFVSMNLNGVAADFAPITRSKMVSLVLINNATATSSGTWTKAISHENMWMTVEGIDAGTMTVFVSNATAPGSGATGTPFVEIGPGTSTTSNWVNGFRWIRGDLSQEFSGTCTAIITADIRK